MTHTHRRSLRCTVLLLLLLTAPAFSPSLRAQEVFLGEIDLVPYNFAMVGFAECNGQLLPISQNTALFSLLGTTYGGDGKTTFALPDLRDRVPIHAGKAPGLSEYVQGEAGGEYSHTLTVNEMPVHTHVIAVSDSVGTSPTPAGNVFARNAAGYRTYSPSSDTTMSPGTVEPRGGGAPHGNLQPYLGMKYVIALQGIFPTRP